MKTALLVLWVIPLLSTIACAAARAQEAPEVIHVGMVMPDVVGTTVQAGRVEAGRQLPYERRPGDEIRERGKEREVLREGRFLGWLVGKKGDVIFTEDTVVGQELDTGAADSPASYTVSSPDDAEYGGGLRPVAVYRKSKPSNFGRWNGWPYKAPIRHVIYLKLPKPLKPGCAYEIATTGVNIQGISFAHRPRRFRSEAVHVSHVGFRPDDPAKVAFLSCWLGSGGPVDYGDGRAFSVLDDATGRAVLEGTARRIHTAGESEDAYNRDYAATNVYEMDFTELTEPGTYRVCVEGIGCSYPFRIAEDAWEAAFAVSARGFYHQRSGIELGPPYTDYERLRCFHPDDGVKVYHSDCPLMESGNGLNALGTDEGNFGNLVKGRTNRIVPDAWGGYMDAGDWDRRIQHLRVSRDLIELAVLFPDYFDDLNLSIPESGDGLPDVVSEALFNLDCYRRMQTPEGGIRGGIESAEHPRHGEASWQESLDVMAYAPGAWSSYVYAGVAARAAYFLQDRKPDLADAYHESALRAMEWAEKEHGRMESSGAFVKWQEPARNSLRDDRNLAAAETFRLTGDRRWNDLFLATTAFREPGADLFVWQDHDQREAPWVYVRTDRPGKDAGIEANCRAAILKEADGRLASTERSSFRYAKYEWQPGMWGAFAAPDAVSLVRAHLLTDDAKYLRAAVLACQMGAGANPVNVCYTTGLGHQSPRNPLHIDSRITHQPPPPGLTVGGPIDVERNKDYWAQKIVGGYCHPDVLEWPTLEAFWDVFWYPPMCEFTVQSPMSQNAYVWGYLAARPGAR